MTRNLGIFALAVLVAGCGYSTSTRTAKDIKSIAVPFFENQTPEPNLEIVFTEQVINNIIDDNTLKVVNEDQADALLEGAIVVFRNNPFSFNQELNAEEYRVIITVQATLFSRKQNEAIWADQRFSGDGSYFLDATGENFTYEDALAEAVSEITDLILNLTVRDW